MRAPIPNTSIEQWRCIELQWPDDDEWLPILFGMLSQFMRGRYWDEKSGSVIDAQAVGREIWARNNPLVPCRVCDSDNGQTDEPASSLGASGIQGGCGDDDCEDCEMPCITELTIESGNLYAWYGPCCKILVGQVGEAGGETPDYGPDDPETEVTSCPKAYASGDLMYAVSETIAEAGFTLNPWEFVGAIIAAHPQVPIDRNWAYRAALLAYGQKASFSTWSDFHDQYFTETQKEALVCAWDSIIADGDPTITSAEHTAMRGSVVALLDSPSEQSYKTYVFDAVTYAGFNGAAAGAWPLEGEVDCSCPDTGGGGSYPSVGIRWLSTGPSVITETYMDYTWQGNRNSGLTAHHYAVSHTDEQTFKKIELTHPFDVQSGVEITELTIRVRPKPGTSNLLMASWHETSGCDDEDDIQVGTLPPDYSSTETYSESSEFEKWLQYEWAEGDEWTVGNWLSGELRNCLRDADAKVYEWYIDIISVNGVLTGITESNPCAD